MRRLSARRYSKRNSQIGPDGQAGGSDIDLSIEDYDSFEEEALNKMSKIENEVS